VSPRRARASLTASPVLVGALALYAGGPEGWRWAWIVLGVPVSIVGVAAFFMREPPRGQFEKDDVVRMGTLRQRTETVEVIKSLFGERRA